MSDASSPVRRVRPHNRIPPNTTSSNPATNQHRISVEHHQSPKNLSSNSYGSLQSSQTAEKASQTGSLGLQEINPKSGQQYAPSLVRAPAYTIPGSGIQQVRQTPQQVYPEFLPFLETLRLQLTWCLAGLKDALRLQRVINIVVSDGDVRAHMVKSFVLNTLGLISIFTFDLIILPLLHRKATASSITQTTSIYQLFWILPVMGGSLYFNGLWCSTIAERVYISQYGRQHAAGSTSYTGLITAIASSAYRIILIVTSITMSFALSYIPIVGKTLSFIFTCWVDSYYCFEFVWQARGLSLAARVKYLEERWAYFLGFGLPTTALCVMGSSLVNVAIFALIFPSFIILAIFADPTPSQPYSPAPPIISRVTGDTVYPLPSPFVPVRFPVFWVVISINDWVIRGLDTLTGGGRRQRRQDSTQRRWGDDQGDHGLPMESPIGSTTFSPTSAGLRNRMRM